jgi:hypothetical protein
MENTYTPPPKTHTEVEPLSITNKAGASAPKSPDEARERTRTALANGIAKHEGLTRAIEEAFHIRPNWDTKTNRAAVQSLKEQGASREQIEDFRRWWYSTDFRGKQNQPPIPSLIAELWPQAFKERKNETVSIYDFGTVYT